MQILYMNIMQLTAGLPRKRLQKLQLIGKWFYILFSNINGQFLPSRERQKGILPLLWKTFLS